MFNNTNELSKNNQCPNQYLFDQSENQKVKYFSYKYDNLKLEYIKDFLIYLTNFRAK